MPWATIPPSGSMTLTSQKLSRPPRLATWASARRSTPLAAEAKLTERETVDPATLSADLDSVARVLDRGANTVVVAHLYGYPADLPAVRALAEQAEHVLAEAAVVGQRRALLVQPAVDAPSEVLDEPAEHLPVEPPDGPGRINGDPGQWRSFVVGMFRPPQESRTISSTGSTVARRHTIERPRNSSAADA